MACDSLYSAWLKAHYPYEFYVTMLKLYTEKGNKEKIALIVDEMKRYKGILMTPGTFGQDNRDWYIDKEAKTISQSLSSIKFMSPGAAEDLYTLGQRRFDSFVDLLRALQMETCVKKNQIELLILLDYFRAFGHSQKLLNVMSEFNEGKYRLTKTLSDKSIQARTPVLKQLEQDMPDDDITIDARLRAELEYMCICLSFDPFADDDLYFVRELDDQYGVKAMLYNVQTGKGGPARIRKELYAQRPFKPGQVIRMTQWKRQPRSVFKDGKRIPLDITDVWAVQYEIVDSER